MVKRLTSKPRGLGFESLSRQELFRTHLRSLPNPNGNLTLVEEIKCAWSLRWTNEIPEDVEFVQNKYFCKSIFFSYFELEFSQCGQQGSNFFPNAIHPLSNI